MVLNIIILLLITIIIVIYLFSNSNNNQIEIVYSEQDCSKTDLENNINEYEKIWIVANLDIDKISCENSLKSIILSDDISPNLIADCSDLMINNDLTDNINNLNILLELYQKSDINIVNYNTNSKILTGYIWEDKTLPTYFDKTRFILDNSLSLKYLNDINIDELSSNQVLTFILITNY